MVVNDEWIYWHYQNFAGRDCPYRSNTAIENCCQYQYFSVNVVYFIHNPV